MEIKAIWQSKFNLKNDQEVVLFAGFVLTFTFLSFSKYKLPHYIFELFPFAAIIFAKHWLSIQQYFDKGYSDVKKNKFYLTTKYVLSFQIVVMALLWIICGVLVFYCFPSDSIIVVLAIYLGLVILSFYLFFRFSNLFQAVFVLSICSAIGVNLMLNMHVYPTLLKYQTGGTIGRILVDRKISDEQFFNFTDYGRAIDFYGGRFIKRKTFEIQKVATYLQKGNFMLVNEEQYKELEKIKTNHKVLYEGNYYSVTLLTLEFLNPKTRLNTTQKRYLVEVM
jgi:hypothetical protein